MNFVVLQLPSFSSLSLLIVFSSVYSPPRLLFSCHNLLPLSSLFPLSFPHCVLLSRLEVLLLLIVFLPLPVQLHLIARSGPETVNV